MDEHIIYKKKLKIRMRIRKPVYLIDEMGFCIERKRFFVHKESEME